MKPYALMLAVSVSILTLAISPLYAAPACCTAAQASKGKLAAAMPTQVNSSLVASEASSGETASNSATTTTEIQGQKLEVTTTYSPSVITVEKGKPVVLKVHRKDAKNCGGELLIPAFDVRAEIPAGQTTKVKFTPTKSGTFPFTCGMQMMKGQLVVKEAPGK